jgi:hypothetical protein
MPNDKPLKVEFAPGAFDHFDGTQEELDELMSEITAMFEGKRLKHRANHLVKWTLMSFQKA